MLVFLLQIASVLLCIPGISRYLSLLSVVFYTILDVAFRHSGIDGHASRRLGIWGSSALSAGPWGTPALFPTGPPIRSSILALECRALVSMLYVLDCVYL